MTKNEFYSFPRSAWERIEMINYEVVQSVAFVLQKVYIFLKKSIRLFK